MAKTFKIDERTIEINGKGLTIDDFLKACKSMTSIELLDLLMEFIKNEPTESSLMVTAAYTLLLQRLGS